jgi:hypothetical protein
MEDQLTAAGIVRHEVPIGADRLIVVYVPPDTGGEIDPNALFGLIGADATARESDGWLLASIDTMNLRHAGIYLGLEGSGIETKLAVVALFARS